MTFAPQVLLQLLNYQLVVVGQSTYQYHMPIRGGSRTAARSKVELFVIIVNGSNPLTIITKSSTLNVEAVLDPSLPINRKKNSFVSHFNRVLKSDIWRVNVKWICLIMINIWHTDKQLTNIYLRWSLKWRICNNI